MACAVSGRRLDNFPLKQTGKLPAPIDVMIRMFCFTQNAIRSALVEISSMQSTTKVGLPASSRAASSPRNSSVTASTLHQGTISNNRFRIISKLRQKISDYLELKWGG
jgi:hypothetical protein